MTNAVHTVPLVLHHAILLQANARYVRLDHIASMVKALAQRDGMAMLRDRGVLLVHVHTHVHTARLVHKELPMLSNVRQYLVQHILIALTSLAQEVLLALA